MKMTRRELEKILNASNIDRFAYDLNGGLPNEAYCMEEMVAKQVHQVLTRVDWKDEGVRKACVSIRKYQSMLGYSEQWMTEYVHTLVMLAKKEPHKNSEE